MQLHMRKQAASKGEGLMNGNRALLEQSALCYSGVAEWARELIGDRTVNGSSPAAVKKQLFASLRNFGNSVYPALPVSFG